MKALAWLRAAARALSPSAALDRLWWRKMRKDYDDGLFDDGDP